MSVTIHPPGAAPAGNTGPNAQDFINPPGAAAPAAPAAATAPAAPAQPTLGKGKQTYFAEDSRGRKIGWRRLNALEDFDLTEIAGGQNAGNEEWMLRATLAFGVREIDGEQILPPTSKAQLRAMIARLDDEGMEALAGLIEGLAVAKVAADAGGLQRAKN